MSSAPAGGTDLATTFGAYLASAYFVCSLWGISSLQTFYYFVNYPNDVLRLKVLVSLSWILDTTHAALVCGGIWQYIITHFGDYDFLYQVHPVLLLEALFTGLISLIVQAFFVRRIYILSRRHWIFPSILLLAGATVQPCLMIVDAVLVLREPTIDGLTKAQNLVYAANGIAAGVDVTIAVLMVILLLQGRSTLHKGSNIMFVRLIIISITTGMWTAAFGLAVIILLVASPSTLIYGAAHLPIAALYCNTLLANLNARTYLRGTSARTIESLEPLSFQFLARNRVRATVGRISFAAEAEDDLEVNDSKSIVPANVEVDINLNTKSSRRNTDTTAV